MKNLKPKFNKFIYIPGWLIVVLAFISAAALVTVFAKGWDTSLVAYVAYVFSFYSLMVFCFWFSEVFPKFYGKVKRKIYANEYTNRYMTDVIFKTHVLLYLSLAINLIYVAANVVSGFLNHTVWFFILAGYYTILALMRFLLLRFVNKNGIGKERIMEFRRSRMCAIILLTLNFTLSGAVLMIMYQNRGYEYPGILIYVMAMYTFYAATHSIMDIIKYRKYNSPVMSTAKVINLASALVSMLALETAMLSQFGGENISPYFNRIMIGATGGGVSIVVIGLSVYLIIGANRAIGEEKSHSGK